MPKDLKGKELPTGIYQRKDGRYDARALINGQKIQLYGTNLKKLVEEFEEAKKKAKENNSLDKYKEMTLWEWFDSWFEKYKKPAMKLSSAQTSYWRFKRTFGIYIGDIKISKISNMDVQDCINAEMARKISPKTIHNALGVLKECFESAKNNKIISANPCFDIFVPWKNTSKKDIIFLTDEEQKIFLNATRGSWYEEMFYIMFYTGMRVGEVGGLQWKDVDFENKCINIRRSLAYDYKDGKKKLFLTAPKTLNSYRKIPFAQGVEEAFLKQKSKQELLKRKLRDRYRATGEFEDTVFVTSLGSLIGRYIAEKECRNIVEEIDYAEAILAVKENREPKKFKAVHPHAIRHTFCSRCFKNKIDPKVVQTLMGHQHYSTTIDIYTHVIEEDLTDEFAKFGVIEDSLPRSENGLPKSNSTLPDLSAL